MKAEYEEIIECINYQISLDQENVNEKMRMFFCNNQTVCKSKNELYVKENDVKFTKMLKNHIKYIWIEIDKFIEYTNAGAREELFSEAEKKVEPYLVRTIEAYLSKRDTYLKDNNISECLIYYNETLSFPLKEAYQKRLLKDSYLHKRLHIVRNKARKTSVDLKNQIIANLISALALIISIMSIVIAMK